MGNDDLYYTGKYRLGETVYELTHFQNATATHITMVRSFRFWRLR